MNILFVGGIWLGIAAVASLLIGSGARVGSRRQVRPLPPRPPRPTSDNFLALAFEDWAAAAQADATRTLLDTRPGVVRRVFDSYPERES